MMHPFIAHRFSGNLHPRCETAATAAAATVVAIATELLTYLFDLFPNEQNNNTANRLLKSLEMLS